MLIGSRARGTALVLILLCIITLSGCGTQVAGTGLDPSQPTTVVVTFDDGPMAADVADPLAVDNASSLLDPLRQIVATLQRRNLQGVFYIKGPGTDNVSANYQQAFTDGLAVLHDAGEVMGYHAFNHDRQLWTAVDGPADQAQAAMERDLRHLQDYVASLLTARSLTRDDYFTPIFRQPYGGEVLRKITGVRAATDLSLIYHGYRIDSIDWLHNADVDAAMRAKFPAASEDEYVAFVKDTLRQGVIRQAGRPIVDILFHVNALTARHLDDWIDAVQAAFTQTGGPVSFAVPSDYLTTSDPAVDLQALTDLLHG